MKLLKVATRDWDLHHVDVHLEADLAEIAQLVDQLLVQVHDTREQHDGRAPRRHRGEPGSTPGSRTPPPKPKKTRKPRAEPAETSSPNSDEKKACPKCGKIFSYPSYMQRHYQTHDRESKSARPAGSRSASTPRSGSSSARRETAPVTSPDESRSDGSAHE
jgi:C2H2 type zinc finger protein